jgi:hypothetical protein
MNRAWLLPRCEYPAGGSSAARIGVAGVGCLPIFERVAMSCIDKRAAISSSWIFHCKENRSMHRYFILPTAALPGWELLIAFVESLALGLWPVIGWVSHAPS